MSKSVEKLIYELENDEDYDVRLQAAIALSNFKTKEAILSLIHALENDEYSYVREEAAIALGKIKAKDAIPILLNILFSLDKSKYPELFTAISEVLEKLGIPKEDQTLASF